MTDLDTRWNARTRLALAKRSVDLATADAVLAEVAQHCAETGESPEEAFGPADEYAETVVKERIPPEARTEQTWDNITYSEHLGASLLQTGWLTMLASIVMWIFVGTMAPLTTASVTGGALLLLAVPSCFLAYTLSGTRVRAATAWGVAGVVLVALASTAFTTLPTTSIGRLPAPALCAFGLALFVWGFNYGSGSEKKTSALTPRADADTTHAHDTAHHAAHDTATAVATGPTADAWLRELRTLLKDRHGLPAARVAELTDETAHHLDATGSAPEEEFGPVELYAVRVADQEPTPRQRWWLRDGVRSSALGAAVVGTGTIFHIATGQPGWVTVLGGVAFVLALGLCVNELVLKKRSKTTAR